MQAFLRERHWADADKLLEKQHPRSIDVWQLHLTWAAHLQDLPERQRAAEHVVRLLPDDSELDFIMQPEHYYGLDRYRARVRVGGNLLNLLKRRR